MKLISEWIIGNRNDRDETAGEQKAQEQGRIAGLDNQPSSDATEPCDREKQIKRDYEALARDSKSRHVEKLQALNDNYLEIKGDLEESVVTDCGKQARRNVLEAKMLFSRELEKIARHRNRCKRRLAALLDKGINVSSSTLGSYTFVYAVLFFFLFVESFANSYFLGMGSDLGMLGGGIEAFFIASLSIVLSFSAGIGIHAISGKGVTRRLACVFGSCFFFAALVAYHTLIGWYRGCLVYLNSETAKADAIGNFMKHGLGLPDLHCYGLTVVGIFFGITAFVAGMHRQEARLAAEYGRIKKEYEDAEKKLDETEKSYYASVHEACIKQQEEVGNRLKNAHAAGSKIRSNVLEIKKVIRSFKESVNDISSAYANVVELFRRSNKAVRDTPAPAYFDEPPSPLDKEFLTLDTSFSDEVEQTVGDLKSHLKKLNVLAEAEKDSIGTDYAQYLREMPGLLAQFRGIKENDFAQLQEGPARTENKEETSNPPMILVKPVRV